MSSELVNQRNSSQLPTFSSAAVSEHSTALDAWVVYAGKVFDITKFLSLHPGGEEIMLDHLGMDVTDVLNSSILHKHSSNAIHLLKQYCIGELNEADRKRSIKSFSLDGFNEEKLIDWSRALTFQVGKLGDDYEKWVHSPVNRPLKLFDNPVLEYLTRTPWYVVPLVWIPMVLYMSWLSCTQRQPSIFPGVVVTDPIRFPFFFAFFSLGIFLWTLIEYALHRFVFHLVPSHPLVISFHFMIHGQHHKVPFDTERLVFPPIPAGLIMLPIFIALLTFFPLSWARALFAGGLLGYIIYDLSHYYIHHASPKPNSYFGRLKSYHAAHHYNEPNMGFGVSTKLWDYPFRTLIPGY